MSLPITAYLHAYFRHARVNGSAAQRLDHFPETAMVRGAVQVARFVQIKPYFQQIECLRQHIIHGDCIPIALRGLVALTATALLDEGRGRQPGAAAHTLCGKFMSG
jgi:hypothetical protein